MYSSTRTWNERVQTAQPSLPSALFLSRGHHCYSCDVCETPRAHAQGAEECIAQPMGLYMVNERSGKLGEPVHPFGPGGEGGRDDAIYSSPANLQVRIGSILVLSCCRRIWLAQWTPARSLFCDAMPGHVVLCAAILQVPPPSRVCCIIVAYRGFVETDTRIQ